MSQVKILCPNLKRLVPTGFDLPKAAFDGMTDAQLNGNSFTCQCGNSHTWNRSDAVIDD